MIVPEEQTTPACAAGQTHQSNVATNGDLLFELPAVALSPRDVSLFFGRFSPMADGKGPSALGELYERQVYMTIEQAEDLVRMLTESIRSFNARKVETEVNSPTT